MKKIAILGSTGSIGTQTLDIVREQKDIEVVALAAGNNITLLEQQVREFSPKLVCVFKEEAAEALKIKIADTDTKVVSGMEGLIDVAVHPESEILCAHPSGGQRTQCNFPVAAGKCGQSY